MIGVKFDSKHSYDDFGLILSSKSVPLPKPKTESVTVPGSELGKVLNQQFQIIYTAKK